VLSLPDAAKLVAARGSLMQALPAGGAMVAVRAAEEELELPDRVAIAAVNGPRSVVLSGDEEAVLAYAARFEHTRLTVSHAFHSPLMDPMLADFREVARELRYAEPVIGVVSTVTPDADWTDPEYWVRQIREPVRFADAATVLVDAGVTTFVELGPDAVLSGLLAPVLPDGSAAVPALRRDRSEQHTAVELFAHLHARGVAVDWSAFPGRHAVLPTYPFQRERYWLTTRAGRSGTHPVLDAAVPVAGSDEVLFSGVTDEPLTGAALADLVWHAGREVGFPVVDLDITSLPDETRLQVKVGAPDGDTRPVSVHAWRDGWVEHAHGTLSAGPVPDTRVDLGLLVRGDAEPAAWRGLRPVAAGTAVQFDGTVFRDDHGVEVARVDEVRFRSLNRGVLHELAWVPVDVPDSGPELEVIRVEAGPDPVTTAHTATRKVLAELRDRALDGSRVVVVTPDPDDPGVAAVWGLVRAAQAEAPDRVFLVGGEGDPAAAVASGEPQVWFRDGTAFAPRLVPMTAPTRPLGDAVVHRPEVPGAAVLSALGDDALAEALRQTADRAWDLHSRTPGELVFVSTVDGLGATGRAHYAAGVAFMQALAARRHAQGLPGCAVVADSAEVVLTDRPVVVTAPLADLPDSPLLRGLVPVVQRASLAQRFAAAPEDDRHRLVEDTVRDEVAAVLGHGDPRRIDLAKPLRELGFDSLTAVDLRNRLVSATGLALEATLVFDHPTPAALTGVLLGRLTPEKTAPPVLEVLDRLEEALEGLDSGDEERAAVTTRLRSIMTNLTASTSDTKRSDLASASATELFDFIDNQLGRAAG
jgi:malonyl CoA-acyl carrier protein transacylase